jgi:hypothetical protein
MRNPMRNFLFLLALTGYVDAYSQNLLTNPDAESGDPTSVGWTDVSMGSTGSSCYNNSGWRILGNQNGFPVAEHGSYFFYAGCSSATGSTFEVRQDVNVSANAGIIDQGWDAFTFSGYMQVYTQSPPDQAEFIIEYRNSANTTVLTSYATGLTSNEGTWTFYSNTTTAPVGTRYIRVRLLSKLNTGPSIDGYFDNLSLTTNIPLPVVLSSFTVATDNTKVKLVWTTSSESGARYFSVQRSTNQSDWTDVQRVEASGGSDTSSTYISFDNDPLAGVSYYRLKETDNGGNITYSEIREINFTSDFSGIQLYPNPAKNYLTLSGADLQQMQVSLYNNIGQMVLVSRSAANNSITINTSGLTRGIYFLRLSNMHSSEIREVVIQ